MSFWMDRARKEDGDVTPGLGMGSTSLASVDFLRFFLGCATLACCARVLAACKFDTESPSLLRYLYVSILVSVSIPFCFDLQYVFRFGFRSLFVSNWVIAVYFFAVLISYTLFDPVTMVNRKTRAKRIRRESPPSSDSDYSDAEKGEESEEEFLPLDDSSEDDEEIIAAREKVMNFGRGWKSVAMLQESDKEDDGDNANVTDADVGGIDVDDGVGGSVGDAGVGGSEDAEENSESDGHLSEYLESSNPGSKLEQDTLRKTFEELVLGPG
ncbi:uncharacterized protein LOC120003535 [Tripterygium wilfordii]|uniref:uncharacterized protein LOC120003535 n=1 Tax=Tripterygium wilfordii TaxID=458696 RepID=UPI0018F7FACF|nr:uncharacterized protein LOC120003535 [Tripterygium wilfordii]